MRQFYGQIVPLAKQRSLMSSDHFLIDGTMAEAWPSQKSFWPNQDEWNGDGPKRGWWNREADFQGRQGRRDTHESAMDPEMQQWRKSQKAEAKRSDPGHGPEEDRQGLIKTVRERPGVEQKCDAQRSYGTEEAGSDSAPPRSMQQYGTAEWMPCEASRRMLDEPVEAHPVVGTCSKGGEASEVKLGGCEKAEWRLPQRRRARGD